MRDQLRQKPQAPVMRRFKNAIPPEKRIYAPSRRALGLSRTSERTRGNRLARTVREGARRERPTEIPGAKRLRTRNNSNWCSAFFLQKRIHREWCCFQDLSETPAVLRSAFAQASYLLRREKSRFASLTWGFGCLLCMNTVACQMTEGSLRP